MKWWKILKNAKVSGKATGKGKSFDASKIKINIDKDDCCEEFWKTIQEFRNEHIIVVKVMGGKRFGEIPSTTNPFTEFSFDGITVVPNRVASFKGYTFDGIGHNIYKNDTLIMPMSSKEPCKDSYNMFKFIEDIWNHFIINGPSKEWDNHIVKNLSNMYTFLPEHYEDATIDEIREWPRLVSKFYEAFDELNRAFQNCPELMEEYE